jgi:hypothetical protein
MEPNHEILVDYLDKNMSPVTSSQVETMVKENRNAAAELQYLKLAIDTVRLDAIRQQVTTIRESFEKNQIQTLKPVNGVVHKMYRISMRVAAIFILVIGIAFLYKYISVNGQSVYEKQFSAYELTSTRGQEKTEPATEAYKNKNWNEVISIYDSEAIHSNKSSFLAGTAQMQQNHFPQAVVIFETLLVSAGKTGNNSFVEETEYYLSLAYLMNHDTNKAVHLIDRIKANPNHTYYPLASKISYIDLKIIDLKK